MGEKGKRKLELIGKIILADFLEYRLEKYINFVNEVEGLPHYKKLTRGGVIIRKPFLDAKILREEKESISAPSEVGVIAEVKKGLNFYIHYIKAILNREKEDIRNGRVKKAIYRRRVKL